MVALDRFADRYVGIRPGELPRALSMLGYFFVCSASTNLVETCAYTLFLTRFNDASLFGLRGVRALPLVWAVSGLLVVPAVSALRGRLATGVGRRFAARRDHIVLATTVAMAALPVVFRVAIALWRAPSVVYVFPALVIAYDVLLTLSVVNMEVSANDLFNAREAKRVAGFISGGRVLGSSVVGFSTSRLVGLLGSVPNLLWAGAALMLLSGAVFLRIARQFRQRFLTAAAWDAQSDRETHGSSLWNPRYVLYLAGMTLFAQLTYYLVDYSFKTSAREHFPGREAEMAGFFGVFFGGLGVAKLVIQFGFTSRLFSRFGMFLPLLALPVGQTALGAATGLAPAQAFARLAVLKGYDNALRWTVLVSATPLLYQPLPHRLAARAQHLVTGIASPISVGASGLVLVVLTNTVITPANVHHVGVAVAGIALAWIVLTRYLQREYIQTFVRYTRRSPSLEHFDLTDPRLAQALLPYLTSADVAQVTFCVNLLDRIRPPDYVARLEALLDHRSPEVQALALEKLASVEADAWPTAKVRQLLPRSGAAGDGATDRVAAAAIAAICAREGAQAIEYVSTFLTDERPAIRAAAVSGLMANCGLEGILYAGPVLKTMMSSEAPQERIAACRTIARSGLRRVTKPILRLLEDPDPRVRRQALAAAGATRRPRLIPAVVEALGDPDTMKVARDMLAQYDAKAAIAHVVRRLHDGDAPLLLRRNAARTLAYLDPVDAAAPLIEAAALDDETLRTESLQALAQLTRDRPLVDASGIQRTLAAEIRDYFHLLRVRTAATDTGLLRDSLTGEMRAVQRRVLLCLRVLYPQDIIASAQFYLSSASAPLQAKGLELLDNTLREPHRTVVLTVLDEADDARKLKHAPTDAVGDVAWESFVRAATKPGASRRSPWIRAVALRVATEQGLALPEEELLAVATLDGADVVAEEAMRALHVADAVRFRQALARAAFPPESGRATTAAQYVAGAEPMLSTLDKVLFLNSVSLFHEIEDEDLVEIALKTKEEFFPRGAPIFRQGEIGDYMYIVVSGRVRVHLGERTLAELGERAFFGDMAVLDAEPRSADVTAIADTELLRLAQRDLLHAMSGDVAISQGIMRVLSQRIRALNEKIQQQRDETGP
jgi:HEAT repeat protein